MNRATATPQSTTTSQISQSKMLAPDVAYQRITKL